MPFEPLALTAATSVSAMGHGRAATLDALLEGRSGLRPNDYDGSGWIGRVGGLETHRLPAALAAYDCRNNRLADMALQTDGFAGAVAGAVRRHGADRIGVVLGTSTSGVLACEEAYAERGPDGALPASFDYDHTHDMFSAARYVRAALGLRGPALVVSTACASAAKTFIDAGHLIRAGLCDAAVVGGVDTLCRLTLRGFASLELISPDPCRPCDAARSGISIGEAAGLALLEPGDGPVQLLGAGATSDGYHMSSPHPEGAGAVGAMLAALNAAGVGGGGGRLHQPARHGDAGERCDGGRRRDCGVRAGNGVLLYQGLVRSRAGRLRDPGGGDRRAGDGARLPTRLPRDA